MALKGCAGRQSHPTSFGKDTIYYIFDHKILLRLFTVGAETLLPAYDELITVSITKIAVLLFKNTYL
jgi:hypothetical protein